MKNPSVYKGIKVSLCMIAVIISVLHTCVVLGAEKEWALYAPYVHSVGYHYIGTDKATSERNVIMEYSPDSKGIYQTTVFEGEKAIAYVYQMRDTGVYEIACFETYSDVEDLRYSADANDNVESLELPNTLSVGTTYYSGYGKDVKNIILSNTASYTINQKRYTQIIKIERHLPEGIQYRYYAPNIGLIAIEDASGNVQYVLTETYGSLYD